MLTSSDSDDREPKSASIADTDILWLSACELARMISDKMVTSEQVVRAHIRQIEAVDTRINAVTERRFELALHEARVADTVLAQNTAVGPLHGVPISVKQMIDVEGMKTSWGTTKPVECAVSDAPAVAKMRAAGAIILAHTNVPQLGLFLETDNPVDGQTNNPWKLDRSSGGSSGGEAALIAAGGVPLGIASDLGGSIRIPAHCCGIHGLKPTSHAISNSGVKCLGLGYALDCVVGPMARHVEDLVLSVNIMSNRSHATHRQPECDPGRVDICQLRMAVWDHDEFFPVSPAIRRAVREAAEVLQERGANIVEFHPPSGKDILELYVGLLSADGGAEIRRALAGSRVDHRLARMLRLGSLPRPVRHSLAAAARWKGQHIEAHLLAAARRRSTDEYWRLCQSLHDLRSQFGRSLDTASVDLILLPPYALPAIPHGRSMDLIAAAGFAFLPNLLGYPAGVLSTTQVQDKDLMDPETAKDRVKILAASCDMETAGLPVGVQLMARPWREDAITAAMLTIESKMKLPPPPLAQIENRVKGARENSQSV